MIKDPWGQLLQNAVFHWDLYWKENHGSTVLVRSLIEWNVILYTKRLIRQFFLFKRLHYTGLSLSKLTNNKSGESSRTSW